MPSSKHTRRAKIKVLKIAGAKASGTKTVGKLAVEEILVEKPLSGGKSYTVLGALRPDSVSSVGELVDRVLEGAPIRLEDSPSITRAESLRPSPAALLHFLERVRPEENEAINQALRRTEALDRHTEALLRTTNARRVELETHLDVLAESPDKAHDLRAEQRRSVAPAAVEALRARQQSLRQEREQMMARRAPGPSDRI